MSNPIQSSSNPFRWYLPSFHGDVRLEKKTESTTSIHAYELSPAETEAMDRLRVYALKKRWITDDRVFLPLGEGAYRTKEGVTVELAAPIEKVKSVLARTLKADRKILHAARFADGKLEEVIEARGKDGDPVVQAPADAAVGASVAVPSIGCPVPNFPEEEVRATRVLEAFLSPTQIAEYRKYGVIVARGADTGHQYAVTHRGVRAQMRHREFRSLYDLTEGRPLCVHDWTVPPPEEMLALYLCVALPGNEARIRALPEAMV